MKVTDKERVPETVQYIKVSIGDCFRKDSMASSAFIKTDQVNADGYIAISLLTGRAYSWRPDEGGFTVVEAEVVVYV